MPAPTFTLPVQGSAPNQFATREGLTGAVQGVVDSLYQSILGGQSGSIAYQTRALLYADLARDAGTKAEVWGDGTPAYNGVYSKSGASGSGSWTKIADLATTVIAGRVDALESLFGQTTSAVGGYAFAITFGSADRIGFGIDYAGKAHFERADEALFDGAVVEGWRVVHTDAAGRVLWGAKADGFDAVPSAAFLARLGAAGGGWVAPEAVLGVPAAAQVNGATWAGDGLIRFFSDYDGAPRPYLQREGGAAWLAEVRGPIEFMPASGQSLSVGRIADGDTPEVVTAAAPAPGYGLMFNTGLRGTYNTPLVGGTLTGFVPAVETWNASAKHGETGGAAAMRWLHAEGRAASARDRVHLYRSHGVGGFRIDQLNRGSTAYSNFLIELDRLEAIAAGYGRPAIARAVCWSQGEADDVDGTSYATYLAALAQLHADYDADIRAALGQAEAVHLIMDPPAAAALNGLGRQSSLAQYDYARATPTAHIATPKYFMRQGDTNHLHAEWYAIRGEYYAKCWRRLFVEAGAWTGLRHTTVVRSGASIVVTLEGRVGSLVFDTAGLPAAPNMGFVYSDSTASASIAGVAITGANQITVTLSGVPTGSSKRLSYAWENPGTLPGLPYAGAIGNVRDSDPTPSHAGVAGYATLPNWLQSFNVSV